MNNQSVIIKAKKEALAKCFAKISIGIDSCRKQIMKCNELYPEYVTDEVRKSDNVDTFLDHISSLLAAGRTEVFDALVSALEKESHLVFLATHLKDTLRETLKNISSGSATYIPSGSHIPINRPYGTYSKAQSDTGLPTADSGLCMSADTYGIEPEQDVNGIGLIRQEMSLDISDHGPAYMYGTITTSREQEVVTMEEHLRTKRELVKTESDLKLQTQQTQASERIHVSLQEKIEFKTNQGQNFRKILYDDGEYIKKTEMELLELQKEHKSCTVHHTHLQSEVDKLRLDIVDGERANKYLQEELKELKQKLYHSEQEKQNSMAQKEKELERCKSAVVQKEEELIRCKEDLEEAQAAQQKSLSIIAQKDQELGQCKEDIGSLESQLSLLRTPKLTEDKSIQVMQDSRTDEMYKNLDALHI